MPKERGLKDMVTNSIVLLNNVIRQIDTKEAALDEKDKRIFDEIVRAKQKGRPFCFALTISSKIRLSFSSRAASFVSICLITLFSNTIELVTISLRPRSFGIFLELK